MATSGVPASPFVHHSFISINHGRRNPQSRPATPGSSSIGTISTVTSVSTTSASGMPSPGSSSPTSVTLEPPLHVSYADFVKTWQDPHILRWLTENRCGHHAQAFRENDIRGDIILELDMDTLKEIGIISVGDRTRIKTAIAKLRKLCAGGVVNNGLGGQGPRVMVNGSAPDYAIPKTTGLKLKDSTSSNHQAQTSQDSALTDGTAGAGAARNSRSRPPPLQIDNVREKDLPQIQRADSAKLSSTPTPRGPHPPTGSNRGPPRGPVPPTPQSTLSAHARSTPRLTVPSSTPISGSRSRTPTSESSQPPPFTSDPLPAPPSASPGGSWSISPVVPGLPRNPAPGNLGGGSFARATSPLPIGQTPAQNRIRAMGLPSHQRQSSGTSNSSGSRGHGNNTGSGSSHPYSSPNATLAPISINSHILSPVTENFGTSSTSSTPPHGYSVGRGPFAKSGHQSQDSEVRKKLMKFHLGTTNNSRTLEVKGLEDGLELLERALRKFNVQFDETQTEMDGTLSVGGWGVFLGPDPDAPPLSENELIAIYQAVEHPGREGLYLRQITQSKRSNKLERIFGETPPSSAPSIVGPTSPIEESMNALTANRAAYKKANRASTVSVLSGLGAIPGTPPTSPGGSKSAGSTSAKLRNFFGQRPPSELITSYLPEFFPFADKKVLKKTARNSMMRQSMKPGSAGIIGWGTQAIKDTSRFSTSTMASGRSGRDSRVVTAGVQSPSPRSSQEERRQGMMTLPVPRVSIEGEDGSMQLTLVDEEDGSTAHGHAAKDDGPMSFLEDMSPEATKNQQLAVGDAASRAARRTSKITELKPAGFVPAAAENLVTVDNVTSGIEQRQKRDSIIPPAVAEAVQKRESLQPKEVPMDEDEEEEDEDEDEDKEEGDEDEDEEDEEDEEEEEEVDKKITSNAGNRTIKWIRGALIGSGSFGNVYLAMDAQRGLLMAVKQVQLKSSSYSQERMRSMLTALEREIELLKGLQHENIVQYLDSAIDENHLNIFLEYVPGGSVASLLRNYGAFEEALTKNWVRQILRGLEYLHGQTIIHRDIKGANILVDNKGGIKISDFGISKKVEEGLPRGNNRMSLQGSVFWMAPEVVKQVDYTSKADIWSVGCLIIEMLTSQHPFPDLTQMQAIYKLGFGGAKPIIPTDITPEATDFLRKTFELDHTARPSATELLNHKWLQE